MTDLVRRVGLAIEHAEGPATDIVCEAEARAAIAVVLEEAAKIADEYDDWTYWGQYDNAGAASSAAKEIAAAIRLGRPLTTDEIKEVDRHGHLTPSTQRNRHD